MRQLTKTITAVALIVFATSASAQTISDRTANDETANAPPVSVDPASLHVSDASLSGDVQYLLTGDESAGYASCQKSGDCGKGCGCGAGGGYASCWDRLSNVGGELRFRYHDEHGMFGGRFSPARYNALLTRFRLWGDFAVTDNVTLRAEGFYAESGTDDGFRVIDRNRGDVRNIYFDIQLTNDLSTQIGRQDFLFGAQRVVSPLDWANTRRAFDGVKVNYTGLDQWTWDFFYGNLVRVVVDDFDRSNYDVSLYGAYGTYSGFACGKLDTYYIGYDDQNLGFSRHNLGSRVSGSRDRWLYELEGAFQFGSDTGQAVSDGFFTIGGGRKIDHCWNPVLWAYFDYATGRDNRNRAGNTGYDEVLPLTHKYLGFIDAVKRSNIMAPNVLFTFEPMEHTKFLLWYYHFRAENDGAIVPGVGNAPQSVGMGNRVLGNELDLIGTFQLTDRSKLLLGFSQFWRGNRITGTNDAQFLYGEVTFKF